jgi:hypothetical protein
MSDIDYDNLRPNQIKALTALVEGHTIVEAAALADVSRSTLQKWMTEDAAFRAAFRAVKADALDTVGRKLLRLGIKAVSVLESILDTSQSDAVKARTAIDSLNALYKSHEVELIEDRLKAIEAKLAATNGGQR